MQRLPEGRYTKEFHEQAVKRVLECDLTRVSRVPSQGDSGYSHTLDDSPGRCFASRSKIPCCYVIPAWRPAIRPRISRPG